MTSDFERQAAIVMENLKVELDKINEAEENLQITPKDFEVTIGIIENGVAHHITFANSDEMLKFISEHMMGRYGRA